MAMEYDFDERIERKNTDSFKYDRMVESCGGNDCSLPMWVADMDFPTPPFVLNAIEKRMSQRVLGYTCSSDEYHSAIAAWCDRQYCWKVRPEHVNYIPGVVAGIYLATQCFTEKGDRILIQDPVYHPFGIVPEANGRVIVRNSLIRTGRGFDMDLDSLRRDIRGCRMMILCNPHNPGGMRWSRETLEQVAEICHENGVVVVSDEIHCDMILDGARHVPFASVSEKAREIAITLQAPSKTFNMPGIVCAHTIVPDDSLRSRFFDYIHASDMDLGNVFTYDCAIACYSDEGDVWRRSMLEYVNGNIDLLESGLAPFSDRIRVIRPQASFLVFLDCRGLGFENPDDYLHFFSDRCGVCMNPGNMFGKGGYGYMRMNVGCPRSTVLEAVRRMSSALKQL